MTDTATMTIYYTPSGISEAGATLWGALKRGGRVLALNEEDCLALREQGIEAVSYQQQAPPRTSRTLWSEARSRWAQRIAPVCFSPAYCLEGMPALWCAKLESLRIAVFWEQLRRLAVEQRIQTVLAQPHYIDMIRAIACTDVPLVGALPLRLRLPMGLKDSLKLLGVRPLPRWPHLTGPVARDAGELAVFLPLDPSGRDINCRCTLATAKAWKQRGKAGLIVAATPQIARFFSDAPFPVLPMRLPRTTPSAPLRELARLLQRQAQPFALRGNTAAIDTTAWTLARHLLADSYLQYRFWKRLLEHYRPDALFTVPDTVPVARVAIAAAAAKGIPSITANSVMMDDHPMSTDLAAAYACALGPSRAAVYKSLPGVKDAHVHVTGIPGWDDIAAGNPESVILPAGRKRLIIYATEHTSLRQVEMTLEILTAFGASHGEFGVIVRPHAEDDAQTLRRIIHQRGAEAWMIVERTTPLKDLLARADGVIVGFSSVGAMAICAGKPVISVNLVATGRGGSNYVETGAALAADTPQQLLDSLEQIADGAAGLSLAKGRENYLSTVMANPADSSRRAAEMISFAIEDSQNRPRTLRA